MRGSILDRKYEKGIVYALRDVLSSFAKHIFLFFSYLISFQVISENSCFSNLLTRQEFSEGSCEKQHRRMK